MLVYGCKKLTGDIQLFLLSLVLWLRGKLWTSIVYSYFLILSHGIQSSHKVVATYYSVLCTELSGPMPKLIPFQSFCWLLYITIVGLAYLPHGQASLPATAANHRAMVDDSVSSTSSIRQVQRCSREVLLELYTKFYGLYAGRPEVLLWLYTKFYYSCTSAIVKFLNLVGIGSSVLPKLLAGARQNLGRLAWWPKCAPATKAAPPASNWSRRWTSARWRRRCARHSAKDMADNSVFSVLLSNSSDA